MIACSASRAMDFAKLSASCCTAAASCATSRAWYATSVPNMVASLAMIPPASLNASATPGARSLNPSASKSPAQINSCAAADALPKKMSPYTERAEEIALIAASSPPAMMSAPGAPGMRV